MTYSFSINFHIKEKRIERIKTQNISLQLYVVGVMCHDRVFCFDTKLAEHLLVCISQSSRRLHHKYFIIKDDAILGE